MELVFEEKPATKISTSQAETIQVVPGQTLKIETTPNGAELVNWVCPQGKNWSAYIIVKITETDAP